MFDVFVYILYLAPVLYAVIPLIFVIGIGLEFYRKANSFTNYIPSLLTSLGILGTFAGITLGLLEFDTSNIENSISHLLSGMKTAFITSLEGMGLSIAYQIVKKLFFIKQYTEKDDTSDIDVTDILIKQNEYLESIRKVMGGDSDSSLLNQIRLLRSDFADKLNETRQSLDNIGENISNINKGIEPVFIKISEDMQNMKENIMNVNETIKENANINLNNKGILQSISENINDFKKTNNEATMELSVNQKNSNDILNTILQEINTQKAFFTEFSNNLLLHFKEFSDLLSKSATEQVIEALKQVIIEFNEKLTEQFGQNFKELNNAVYELVNWQENYKNQLEMMIEQYELGVKSISKTSEAVSDIEERTQIIPQSMEKLSQIMAILQEQITAHQEQVIIQNNQLTVHKEQLEHLYDMLSAFSEMKDKAVEAIPEIKTHMNEIISDISESVELAENNYNNLLQKTENMQNIFRERTDDFHSNIEKIIANTMILQTNNIERQTATMEKVFNDLEKNFKEYSDRVSVSFETQINNIKQSFDTLLSDIGRGLETHIKDVFNNADTELTSQVDKVNAYIEEQINNFNKQIETVITKEIEEILGAMGSSLAGIAKRLIEIYESNQS